MRHKKITYLAPALLIMLLFIPVLAQAVTEWTEVSVTSITSDQINPSLSNGRVVWQDYRNKATGCPTAQNCLAADVFAKQLSGGAEQQLTSTPNALDPDISGELVVWRSWDTGKIIVHNISTGAEQNASAAGGTVQQVSPSISGNRIVWVDYRASSDYGDIYMRDMGAPADVAVATGDPTLVTPRKDKRNPDIDGNIVVWEDWRNAFQDAQGWWHNPDIYAKDLSSGTVYAVCTDLNDQYSPTVSGTKVFWQDYRNGNWDIYMKDLATGVETRLTTNAQHQSWPSADGDFVVWKDARNGDEDVYIRRLSTGAEQMLNADPGTNPTALQKLPVIDGVNVAWMDKRNGNWDIYKAADTVAPAISSTGPAGQLTTDSTQLTASYSDAGTAVDTASVSFMLDGASVGGCSVTETSASCPASGLAQGAHTFSVTVADLAGNLETAGGSFEVDSAGPSITNLTPSGWVDTGSLVLSADYSDNYSGVDPASVQVLIDGATAAGCSAGATSVTCAAAVLSEGSHEFTVSASDNFGNPASATASFTIDTLAPAIEGLAVSPVVPDGGHIQFGYSDAGSGVDTASVSVSLDGQPVSGCVVGVASASCDVQNLSFGAHSVTVGVSDNLGNAATLDATLMIDDNAAPLVSAGSPTGIVAAGPVQVSAAYADDPPSSGINTGTVNVSIDGVQLAGCAAGAASVSCQVEGLAVGPHDVTVTVSDVAGNAGSTSWSFNLGEVPVITNMTPAPLSSVNNPLAKISADYAENGRGIDSASIRMYVDGVEVTGETAQGAGTVSFSPSWAGKLSDGLHTARFVVADSQGGIADQEWTFTITSPKMGLELRNVYWASYAAYLARELSVDYRILDPGTGAARNVFLMQSSASNGVIPFTLMPLALGDISGNNGYADFTFVYLVPNGITIFRATSYVNYTDDGGNIYWSPGPPPDGGPGA